MRTTTGVSTAICRLAVGRTLEEKLHERVSTTVVRKAADAHSHHTRRSPWFRWAQAGAQVVASSGGEGSRGAINTTVVEETLGRLGVSGGICSVGLAGSSGSGL